MTYDWPSRLVEILSAHDRRQRLRRVIRRDMAVARKAGLETRHREKIKNATKGQT